MIALITDAISHSINQQALSFNNKVIYSDDRLLSDIISGDRNIPIQFSLIKHTLDVVGAIGIVQKDGLALGELAKNHNKFVVIEAVQRDGHALRHASDGLRGLRCSALYYGMRRLLEI